MSIHDLTDNFCDYLDRSDLSATFYMDEMIVRYNGTLEAVSAQPPGHVEGDAPPEGRGRFPSIIPQQTSQEVRSLAVAISDGRALSHWEEVLGEVALRHVVSGEPFQIKFSPGSSLLTWFNTAIAQETLRAQLQNCDLDTVLLLYEVLGATVLQLSKGGSGSVDIALDDLILALGWDKAARRCAQERNRLRLRVWEWLMVFDSLQVIGKRPGTYKDPGTRRTLDLESQDALLRIMGMRAHSSITAPNGQLLPLEVTIAPGPWIDRHKGNRQILTDFGNVRALARIAPGKAAGTWARCIGMVLLQRWRERAARVMPLPCAEKTSRKATTKRGAPPAPASPSFFGFPHPVMDRNSYSFTRRSLLMGLFRTEPDVETILEGHDPGRARDYWEQAIDLLQDQDFISRHCELEPPNWKRQGWQTDWLDAPLEIVPGCGPLAASHAIYASLHPPAQPARPSKPLARPSRRWA